MKRARGKDLHKDFQAEKECWAMGCTEANIANDRASDGVCQACPILQPKHKIFLSHSGEQKYFVEWLCEDLESHHRFPFFDKRPSSLPKGERFPELILEAAQQCEMAVVVVSEEYFTSKWPMIELNAFVQARLGSNSRLKILPLFFGLSVSEFCEPSRQMRWFQEWNKWAKNDARIKPKEFKNALKVIESFNGIKFNQDMRDFGSYRRDVVSSICNLISADMKWDDSHVQGRSWLCEATREKIQRIQRSGQYNVCVIGFYGMGGIGKTTMCKILCNELSEFEGKVCHVELGAKQSFEELLKEVLRKLTGKSEELLRTLNEGQCLHILRESTWNQRTFLAVDNVWDDSKSIEQAKMFLEADFHEGSVVMVTTRSLKTLAYLGIDDSKCFEMLELGKVHARNLFLYYAAKGKQFTSDKDNNFIEECVARCYFQKSEKQGSHYLPLALKVLGMHLGSLGNSPSDWKENLPKVRDFDYFPEENPVFSILRINFDRLQVQEQTLFMDIALYSPLRAVWNLLDDADIDLIGWLSIVHRQKLEKTESQLQRLIEKGLLEDVDITSQNVSMHDLYREFAVMESQGKLNSASFKSRRWVYEHSCPADLEMTPAGGCWENLIRVGIEVLYYDTSSLQGIQWRYCSNVVVLKLVNRLDCSLGVLNLKGLRCLRSLEIQFDMNHLDGLEGLEDLISLTYFQWIGNKGDKEDEVRSELGQLPASGLESLDDLISFAYFQLMGNKEDEEDKDIVWSQLGQLPASLKVLQMTRLNVNFMRDAFARCTNLCQLKLSDIRANGDWDLSSCKSLQNIVLASIRGLHSLVGFVGGLTSCLQSLVIVWCKDLIDVSGLEHLVGLQHLRLTDNHELEEVPDLQKLTRLQILRIDRANIAEVPGLGSLRQLRRLTCSKWDITELPILRGFKHLHHLDLSWCRKLTTLEGVGDLPALRHLDLQGCGSLLRLPDLCKSTKLEELRIPDTAIELQQKDIRMLAELPMLRPVKLTAYTEIIGTFYCPGSIKLDVVRRKVLKCDWPVETVIEERDLEMPPIRVRRYKF